ncbi:MAG: hypothetical protein IJE00_02200 [Clostridia bacterium]|nr:hypothetical protein [Clostridia bacterium]
MRYRLFRIAVIALAMSLLVACTAQPTDSEKGSTNMTTTTGSSAGGNAGTTGSTGQSSTTKPSSTSQTTGTTGTTGTVTKPTVPPAKYAVKPFAYPDAAVKTLEQRSLSLGAFCARAAGDSNYVGNRHYTGTHIVVSPYFTASVDGLTLPVYATPVYVATGNQGVLHSYASVDIAFGNHDAVLLQLNASVDVDSVDVFSASDATASHSGRNIRLSVSKHGVYTLVLNGDQQHAVTVFVREYEDEAAAIAAYRAAYGKENVIVYEPGLHDIDHVTLPNSRMVLYLKAGAILLPRHTIDILNDETAANAAEPFAKESNGIGLNRFPVINGFGCSDLTIAGRGTVDMTQLDWHERRGVVFTMCDRVRMDGVILVNPCEWAFITYRCSNVTVTQSAVFGYRTNSDAFAICNSTDVQVSDCFARTGDDMFEVKTLGGVEGAVSRDITFSRCQAWGSKARCYGIIGEMEKDISRVTFEDSWVIFRDAVWDNNRIGSLVVLRETGNGKVSDITFRNIQIYYDRGRAINCGNYSADLQNSRITGITFENIRYKSGMNSQLRLNNGAGNSLQILLKNVYADGTRLNRSNFNSYFYCDRDGLATVQ